MVLQFDPELSITDNIERFRAEAESIDADCALILFENLALLTCEGDEARIREAVREFNRTILSAIDELPEGNLE